MASSGCRCRRRANCKGQTMEVRRAVSWRECWRCGKKRGGQRDKGARQTRVREEARRGDEMSSKGCGRQCSEVTHHRADGLDNRRPPLCGGGMQSRPPILVLGTQPSTSSQQLPHKLDVTGLGCTLELQVNRPRDKPHSPPTDCARLLDNLLPRTEQMLWAPPHSIGPASLTKRRCKFRLRLRTSVPPKCSPLWLLRLAAPW